MTAIASSFSTPVFCAVQTESVQRLVWLQRQFYSTQDEQALAWYRTQFINLLSLFPKDSAEMQEYILLLQISPQFVRESSTLLLWELSDEEKQNVVVQCRVQAVAEKTDQHLQTMVIDTTTTASL